VSKTITITLSDSTYATLLKHAEDSEQPLDAVIEEFIAQHLSVCLARARWGERFESLLERVYTRTSQYPSSEIEADISAAAEVKEMRRARCCAD
jgi:predicted CopG family antitoxin